MDPSALGSFFISGFIVSQCVSFLPSPQHLKQSSTPQPQNHSLKLAKFCSIAVHPRINNKGKAARKHRDELGTVTIIRCLED